MVFAEVNEKQRSENPVWLIDQAEALLAGQSDLVANAANLAALLFLSMEDVNWAGFYFLKGDRLVVGPFQGKPACAEIPLGKGVCGVAAATCEIQRVGNVHAFDGHITCDADSRSEIVVPLTRRGEVIGVLDLDSPLPNRFGPDDERLLSEIASVFIRSLGD